MEYRLMDWAGDLTVPDLHWMAASLPNDLVLHVNHLPHLDQEQQVLLEDKLTIAVVNENSALVQPFALVGRNETLVLQAVRDQIESLGGRNIKVNRQRSVFARAAATLH